MRLNIRSIIKNQRCNRRCARLIGSQLDAKPLERLDPSQETELLRQTPACGICSESTEHAASRPRTGEAFPGNGPMPSQKLRYALTLGVISAVGPFSVDMYLSTFPAIASGFHVSGSAVQFTLVSYFLAMA